MSKVKNFLYKLIPTKRRLIQVYAALLYNANIKGFITGEIFEGVSKSTCVPGLNCYSCPGAIGACPLGALQNALSESKTKYPTYVLGIILLYSIILGRTICGFLCPVGLLQELLYKIKTPKLKKNKVTRCLSYFKYVILVVLVLILPLIYAFQNLPLPGFCKYICPAGTFEGAIGLLSNPSNTGLFATLGSLFTWKFILLILFIVASIFIFRFFCRFLCPLGALYGLFNKLSILGVKVDKSKCNHCQACITNCKMDVKEVGDHECIQCGECRKVCHCNAIDWKFIRKIVKEDEEIIEENNNEVSVSSKKDRRINSKTFNRIIAIICGVLLIVVLVVVNFGNKSYKVNDVYDKFVVELTDNSLFDISKDNNTTLIYFYDQLTKEEIDTIKKYSHDKLNIILFPSNNEVIDNEIVDELKQYDVKFTYENNKTLKQLNNKKLFPYSVFIDYEDKIVISDAKEISQVGYYDTIEPIILGEKVGYEVGYICINKEINIIDSDETFSVVNNRGKVTIINFWHTACTPCVHELPYFDKLYKEYSDEITVIAIHEANMYKANPSKVSNFIKEEFTNYSILFGYDSDVSSYHEALEGAGKFPTTVIVDQNGIISYRELKSVTEEELRFEIEKLIK